MLAMFEESNTFSFISVNNSRTYSVTRFRTVCVYAITMSVAVTQCRKRFLKISGGVAYLCPSSDAVMWSETVGTLRKRPVSDQIIGLGLAGLVLRCETRSCYARRHNDLEGHNSFSSTIFSFSILCLEHHYSGDQRWRLLT